MKQLNLEQFTGTENYYEHWSGRITYTDGVKYLADNAGHGAYWLIDVIASYQPRVERFQVWRIAKSGATGAIITMRVDSDTPVSISQKISHTDFPFDRLGGIEFNLWLVDNILILPSEY